MDQGRIRALLQRDPAWSVFALADLHPSVAQHCQWHVSGDAVMLVYTGFDPPILFAQGDAGTLIPQLETPRLSLQVKAETLQQLEKSYRAESLRAMWRMVLAAVVTPPTQTERLYEKDLAELQALHRDGEATKEAPEYFMPSLLKQGVFHGLRIAGELVAAAGTYMVVPEEGVAAIGHVYTRRDQRGRGYGSLVTAAVAAELTERGCHVVALNVEQHNAAAVRVYEKLGFRRHCAFHEGILVRA